MLTLRITKQYDCKGKWYILSLENKDNIIKEVDICVEQCIWDKRDVKTTIKNYIRRFTEKYNGWLIIKDESRGAWKYIEHLVPAYHDNNGVYVKPRTSRVKGEIC